MRARLLLSLALAFSVGCQATLPNATKSRNTRTVAAADVQRLIAQTGVTQEFSGKARIISDNGLGIISNNSGALISDNGLGLISDNGLGIIANNGGGLQPGYSVMATGPRQESFLSDAKIEVLDAQGRLLVDASKKPIAATTDKKGAYTFKAVLPPENLVLRIRLWNGGTLFAMLAYDPDGGARTLDINTSSTLGAQYVLEKFVQKRKEVYDRLPASEAEALQQDMEAARAKLTGKAPSYKPADLLKIAEDLRKQDTTLNQRLDKIEAILLAGQKDLGSGLPATQVSLSFPLATVGDSAGRLFILESSAGRIRRVNTDGTASVAASTGLGIARGMVLMPDGSLIVSCIFQNKVRKVSPDGQVTDLVGTGEQGRGTPVDEKPLATALSHPDALALGPDGTLYIGEVDRDGDARSRLLALKDGKLREVPTDAFYLKRTIMAGIAVTQDGTLYVCDGKNGRLARQKPGGNWEIVAENLKTSEYSRLWAEPDGTVLLAETAGNRVVRVGADGQLQPVAGTGDPGYAGDGGPATAAKLIEPSGLWRDAAGVLYVTDSGNGLIRAIGRDGQIRTVAGTQGAVTQGDALRIAISSPTCIAIDAQGRLVISETTGNTIKRLDGGNLTTIAGTTKGFAGDDGPATGAQFDTPLGIAYNRDGELFVLDASNYRVRKIDAKGVITTVVGNGTRHSLGRDGQPAQPAPALSSIVDRPFGVVIDPNGQPVWSDNANAQVLRLRKDGQVELVAGVPGGKEGDKGDGGPATQAQLKLPSGLAYDKAGNLYIADAGNLRIRKVTPDGTISTFAGLPMDQAFVKLLGGGVPQEEGIKATEALLIGPAALCFDDAGNLYVAEAGTEQLTSLGSVSQVAGLPIQLPKIGARIRKITPDGTITTIAGSGGKVLNKDGDDSLSRPVCLLVDDKGRLVICDGGNNQIKMLPKGSF